MFTPVKKPVNANRLGCLRRFSGQNQPLLRLVCFTWCGAGASVYRRLALSLPQPVELLAVQLPGREERFSEPKLLRMEQIIAHVLPDIMQLDDLPLVFFGHSMGALVAYETAMALKAKTGREPALLVVSGHGSPDSRDHCKQQWHTASEEDFIANIGQLGGTPPAILADRAMMRMLMPALKSDYEVLETWVRQPRTETLSCPLVACAGNADKEVSESTLLAWQDYSSGPFTSHWFNGDHFYLTAQPRQLTRCLEEWMLQEVAAFSAALA